MSKAKPVVGDYIQTLVGAGLSSTNQYADPWAPQTGQSTSKYGLAALHPAVQPALKFLIDGPFWSEYHIIGDNDYDKFPGFEGIDEVLIALIEYQIKKLQYETFVNTLKAIWKDSIVYGFSVSEMSFRYDGRYVCIDTIKPHLPPWFEIYKDPGNNLAQIRYTPLGLTIEKDLLEKFLVVTYPSLVHGNFYGRSILQSIYFDIKVVELLEQAYAEGCRRLSIRALVHEYAGDKLADEEKEAVEQALYDIDNAAVVTLPGLIGEEGELISKHKIYLLEDRASSEGIGITKNLLDILYARINRCLLLPDDLGFANAKVGSWAKAKEEMDMYTLQITVHQDFIESFINRRIIPTMIRYNYPSYLSNPDYNLPVFKFGSVEEEYDLAKLEMVTSLKDIGALRFPQDLPIVRGWFNLPPLPEEDLTQPTEEATPEEDQVQSLRREMLSKRLRRWAKKEQA
jgi:hypothetical protein